MEGIKPGCNVNAHPSEFVNSIRMISQSFNRGHPTKNNIKSTINLLPMKQSGPMVPTLLPWSIQLHTCRWILHDNSVGPQAGPLLGQRLQFPSAKGKFELLQDLIEVATTY